MQFTFVANSLIGSTFNTVCNFAWSLAAPYVAASTRSTVTHSTAFAANVVGLQPGTYCRAAYNYMTEVGADVAAQEAFSSINGTAPLLPQYSWTGKIVGGIFVNTSRICSNVAKVEERNSQNTSWLSRIVAFADTNKNFVMKEHVYHRGYHYVASAGTLAEAYLVNKATYNYLGYASYAAYAAACCIPGKSIYLLSKGMQGMICRGAEDPNAQLQTEFCNDPTFSALRDLQAQKQQNIDARVALACLAEFGTATIAPTPAVAEADLACIRRGKALDYRMAKIKQEAKTKKDEQEREIVRITMEKTMPDFGCPF